MKEGPLTVATEPRASIAMSPMAPMPVPHRYHYVILGVLLLCNMMNQGHRQLLAVLLPAGMRCIDPGANATDDDVGGDNDDCIAMSVAQQGALIGPAFAGPFVLGGIPLAQMSDKFRRTTVLTVSLVLWSTAVLCQAYTTNATVVLLLRMLLGALEAGCNPSAYALLMAYWGATTQSGFAFGGYALGVYLGFGLAYVSAGFSGRGSWRNVWLYAGCAGYGVAALSLLINEPPRKVKPTVVDKIREKVAAGGSSAPPPPPVFFLRKLLGSKKYCLIVAAASCTMVVRFALLGWLATFYNMQHNLPPSEFGPRIGGIIMVAGAISAFSGGAVSDKFKNTASRVNICTLSQLLPMPFWIGVLLVSSPTASFALLFFAMISGDMFMGVAAATLQRIVDPSMAARGNQVYLASSTLLGSCGPLVVGVAVHNGLGLQTILVAMCGTFFTLSGFFFNLLKHEMAKDDCDDEPLPSFDNPAFGLGPDDGGSDGGGGGAGVSDAVDRGLQKRLEVLARHREVKASAHAAVNEAYG